MPLLIFKKPSIILGKAQTKIPGFGGMNEVKTLGSLSKIPSSLINVLDDVFVMGMREKKLKKIVDEVSDPESKETPLASSDLTKRAYLAKKYLADERLSGKKNK